MKKYAFVIAILALVIFASGCTTNQNQTSNQFTVPTKTYSANGIFFNYPDSWLITNTSMLNAVVSFGDPSSVDNSTRDVNTLVIIQKVAMQPGMTLKQAFDLNFAKMATQNPNFQQIADTNTTVDGTTAYVDIHKIDVNGVQKEEKAVWIGKNDKIYVILCGALPNEFDSQQANFDAIINSFHVQ